MPIPFVILAIAGLAFIAWGVKAAPEIQEKRAEAARTNAEKDAATRRRIEAEDARARAVSECAALREEIFAARQQGGDVNAISAMEARYRVCSQQYGLTKPWEAPVEAAAGKQRQIELEWPHFRSTDWFFGELTRKNTMTTIGRLADDYFTNLSSALSGTIDMDGLLAVKRSLETWIAYADVMAECFRVDRGEGCGANPGWRTLVQTRLIAPAVGADGMAERARAAVTSGQLTLVNERRGETRAAALDRYVAGVRSQWAHAGEGMLPRVQRIRGERLTPIVTGALARSVGLLPAVIFSLQNNGK